MSTFRSALRLVYSSAARWDAWAELRRSLAGEPTLPAAQIHRVLVLCHGNICRSPFAAAVLGHQLPHLEVRSGGFFAEPGRSAEPAAIEAARRAGVDLGAHRAHRIAERDLAWADLALVMEGHQLAALARGWPRTTRRAALLGDFLSERPHRIEDPWGRSPEVFDATFARIHQAAVRFANAVRMAG